MWRYFAAIALGLALGLGLAVHTVRAGAFDSNVSIGPWRTGRDFGTADASARTRAIVALSGLLALPAKEARYYTATTDDAGRPLDGRCRYLVRGGPLPGRWWSITVYDEDGYLVGPGPYSVEGAALLAASYKAEAQAKLRPTYMSWEAPRGWQFTVSPAPARGTLWTAGLERFQLTLRLYLPKDGGGGDPPRSWMPSILKGGC